MSISKRVTLIGLVQLVLVVGVLFGLYYRQSKQSTVDQFVTQARAVLLTTEGVRAQAAKQWADGILSAEQLRAWADAGELDKVVSSVPIVTAWRSAATNAKEGGYTFKVPKFSPRNPDNEPDEVETRVLKMFHADNSKVDHFEVDRKLNAVRYFRPIRLTSECLLCHGDPAGSQELWGNDKGLDPTGVAMENWKVGEVHGAFEVIQSLDAADALVAASMWRGGMVVVGLVLAGCGVFFFLMRRSVARPLNEAVDAIGRVAAGDLSRTVEVRSRDEVGRISESVNTMSGSLREFVTQTRASADTVASAAQVLSETSSQLSVGAEQTTSQSATVASAAEEMSTNMATMAEATEQSASGVQTVAGAMRR